MVKIARWIKNKIKRTVCRDLKGSKKDPFLYLGAITAILFGVLVFTGPCFFSEADSFVLSQYSQDSGNTFLTPGTKIKESPDLSFIQKNSLAAVSPPIVVTPQVLGALVESSDYEWAQKEVAEYVVQAGDNLSSIAGKFNISLNTLLWANNLNQNSYLQIGQKLIILPVSGVTHQVQQGDTLSEIAQTYKVEADEIITFNDLSSEGDIFIGDILIIPNGVMPPPAKYAPQLVPLAQSYFICPIASPCRITQGLHWYNAIDFSNGKCGEPVFAAAAGTVLKVKLTNSASKWAFGGAGNYLTVLHPNGVVTFYGHLQTSFVSPGDYVSQGQVIAFIGGALGMPGSGNSTGCHLHFEVIGAKNPFVR